MAGRTRAIDVWSSMIIDLIDHPIRTQRSVSTLQNLKTPPNYPGHVFGPYEVGRAVEVLSEFGTDFRTSAAAGGVNRESGRSA
jgi:hypothetical protein